MNRMLPILAVGMILVGIAGLVLLSLQTQSFYGNAQYGGFGMMGGYGGMMNGNGMMGGRNGMMGGQYGPRVNATPVPANKPVDREVQITALGLKFDQTTITVKKGETVKFTLVNQDRVDHNFVSQDGGIPYTAMPANSTQTVLWVAPEQGTYTAVCTFHPGMRVQIVVQ